MLSDEKKKQLVDLTTEIIRYVMDQVETCRAEELVHDISLNMSAYLKEISEMQNPTLSELAVRMKRSKPTVTIAIDKLEAKDYVRRVQSDDDRRSFHIHLTDKGTRFAEVKNTCQDALYKKISESLNEQEVEQMISLNKKIFR
jgi:DNA-binding MarR family transcriptional regulator